MNRKLISDGAPFLWSSLLLTLIATPATYFGISSSSSQLVSSQCGELEIASQSPSLIQKHYPLASDRVELAFERRLTEILKNTSLEIRLRNLKDLLNQNLLPDQFSSIGNTLSQRGEWEELSVFLSAYVVKYPQKAISFGETSLSPSDWSAIRGSVFQHWVQKNPIKAELFLKNSSIDLISDSVFQALVTQRWSNQKDALFTEGGDWISSWGDEEKQGMARKALIHAMVKEDPQATIHWLSDHGLSDDLACCQVIAREWGAENPTEAFDWVCQLSESTRPQVLETIFVRWGDSDPGAAGEFLNELIEMERIDSREVDRAAFAYSMVVSVQDPDAALSWGESIVEEELRVRAISEIVQLWLGKDRESLLKRLEQDDLSEEVVSMAWNLLEQTEGNL